MLRKLPCKELTEGLCAFVGEVRDEHITYLDRDMWQKDDNIKLIRCKSGDTCLMDGLYDV